MCKKINSEYDKRSLGLSTVHQEEYKEEQTLQEDLEEPTVSSEWGWNEWDVSLGIWTCLVKT